jgi:hypothetical protein
MPGEGKTKRRRRWHCLSRLGAKVCFCLFLLPVSGKTQDTLGSLPGCPPLPEQGRARKISVYAAKALDQPGAVCVRSINGVSAEIKYGELAFWLQKWEDEKGEFQRIEEPDLRGIAMRPVAYGLPIGGVVDRRLPYSRQPIPPVNIARVFASGCRGRSWMTRCAQKSSLSPSRTPKVKWLNETT